MNIVDLDKLCERFWDGNYMEIHKDDIPSIPSAFEGMTNRDVLKALFPIDDNQGMRHIKVYLDHEPIESFELSTTQKWLDSPFKGVSE